MRMHGKVAYLGYCTLGAAVILALFSVEARAQMTFTPLGDLPGGFFQSTARKVSADGSVVVGSSRSASGYEAMRWTAGGGMVGLGDLPGEPFDAFAVDVSADGSVLVGTGNGTSHEPGSEAFRWTSGGGMVGLGDLPGGNFRSFGRGISDDGSIIVGESSSTSGTEAFRWTASGGMVGLGDLPGGGFESGSEGISADGSAIVGYATTALGYEGFRWTAGGGMVGLGDLPGGEVLSAGFGLSADGSIIFGVSSSALGIETFRWTAESGMVGLGDLPGGSVESDPYDISADGSVIVGFGNTSLGREAFLWTSDGGMQNLRELLIAGGATGLTGWTLRQATGVTPDGRTMVGFGNNSSGNTEAWIATIPRNMILPNGVIIGLDLGAGEKLVAPTELAVPIKLVGNFSIAPSATFDITDNAVIVNYDGTSPSATVREKIVSGRGGAGLGRAWNGPGITSSTAAAANTTEAESRSIGYAENARLPLGAYTNFRGQAVDGTSILMAYTRTGDANLDGIVNDDDVTIVGAAYAPGVSQPSWALGDFDYNGFVDDDDVTLLGAFYNPSATPIAAAPVASGTAVAAVPEPAAIVLTAIALLGIFLARRAPVDG